MAATLPMTANATGDYRRRNARRLKLVLLGVVALAVALALDVSIGPGIMFNEKGQNDKIVDASIQNVDGELKVVAPKAASVKVMGACNVRLSPLRPNTACGVTCTVTAAGAPGDFSLPGWVRLVVDGTSSTVKLTPSSDPAKARTTVTIPATAQGLHSITATAVSRSNVTAPGPCSASVPATPS